MNFTILFIIGIIAIIYLNERPKQKKFIIDLEPNIINNKKHLNPQVLEPVQPSHALQNPILDDIKAPYDKRGFGLDSHRNTDNYELQDYLELPLTGTGETYFNQNLADINTEDFKLKPQKYKYLRFTVLETKGDTDKVKFNISFYSNRKIKDSEIKIWNPYLGEKRDFTGEIFDNSTIFYLHDTINISAYEIKASGTDDDPFEWTLEGSTNATYWVEIDSQIYTLPKKGQSTKFQINYSSRDTDI